jgi:hypothetical protein
MSFLIYMSGDLSWILGAGYARVNHLGELASGRLLFNQHPYSKSGSGISSETAEAKKLYRYFASRWPFWGLGRPSARAAQVWARAESERRRPRARSDGLTQRREPTGERSLSAARCFISSLSAAAGQLTAHSFSVWSCCDQHSFVLPATRTALTDAEQSGQVDPGPAPPAP